MYYIIRLWRAWAVDLQPVAAAMKLRGDGPDTAEDEEPEIMTAARRSRKRSKRTQLFTIAVQVSADGLWMPPRRRTMDRHNSLRMMDGLANYATIAGREQRLGIGTRAKIMHII